MKKIFYVALMTVMLYVLISFIQVNAYNVTDPNRISDYNFFSILVKLGNLIY